MLRTVLLKTLYDQRRALLGWVVSLVLLVVSAGWWAHAQNVVAAATRDGARAASALGGSTADGVDVANQLLVAGLGVELDLPLGATSRMLKDEWR